MRGDERHTITALGLSSALGDSLDATWKSLVAGVPRVSPPPFALPFSTVCGLVAGPLDAVPARHAAYDTRLARIALRALAQVTTAVERAKARWGRERIGVLIGTSTGGLDATEPAYRHFRDTQQHTPGFSLRKAHAFDALGGLVRELLDVSGPSYAVSTACTSSAKALASAQRLLRHDVCDAVLVIGADAVCETTVRGFHALGVLSTQPARPFSAERDGIHIGEAAACLLVERNGDGPVHLAAIGETSDAHSMSAPHPEGAGARDAIRAGLARAGLHPSEVDYVNAHGTGTPQNDSAESVAIRAALSDHTPVSSTKGLTGHTLGACGALEAAITTLAIIHGELPVSAGATPVDASLGIRVVAQRAPQRIRVAVSNAFAFGGSNAALVITAS